MKDLRRTDIEGIDEHIHCYKLLVKFLKQEKKYHQFMNLIFYSRGLTIYDLFKTMNETNISLVMVRIPWTYSSVVKKWSSIFNFIPFFGHYWAAEGLNTEFMCMFCERWRQFLIKYSDKGEDGEIEEEEELFPF